MSVNSSSSSNLPLPTSPLSSNIFQIPIYLQIFSCYNSTAGAINITAFTITSILIFLPLYIFVLYLGLQQWQQQSSSKAMSHSKYFTFHMVIMELLNVLGSTLICCGIHTDLPQMIMVGIFLLSINLFGQMLFNLLTCVERYLAVVHPITYLRLRKAKGIRIRNITIGCVWLLCFAALGVLYVQDHVSIVVFLFSFTALVIIVVSFCSLSVLCVLIRPGPGEGSRGRQQVDQSKLRAFYTLMAILGVLVLKFMGNIIGSVLYALPQLGVIGRCSLWFSTIWIGLPSTLVLPFLFLQRAGKLLCCKNNI